MKSIRGKTSSQTINWMAWTSAGQAVSMIISIGSVAVLARLLTQADYGIFAAALIFIAIARSGLVNGGFSAAIIQRQDLDHLHIRNAFTGTLMIHIVAAGLIWAGSEYIAAFFDMPELSEILKVMCLIVVINPVLMISRSLLQRRKRFRFLAVMDVGTSIFANTAVAISLALAGFGVWSLVIANIALAVTRTLFVFGWARFNIIPTITSHMRDLLSVSLGFSLAGALSAVSEQAAKFVIGRVLGADALGVFGRADRVLSFPTMLLSPSLVLFPVMSEMNDDRVRMARGFLRATSLYSLVAIPLTALLWHGAEGLVMLLLGGRWVAAITPLEILSLTLVFGLGIKASSVVFMALGRSKALVMRQAVFAALVVVCSLIGSKWGVNGVCAGVLLTYIATYFFCAHLSNRLLDVGWLNFGKANIHGVLLAIPMLGTLFLGYNFIWSDVHKYLQFPIEAAVAGLVVYTLCIVKPAFFLGPDGVWLLQEVQKRVPSPLRRLLPVGPKR